MYYTKVVHHQRRVVMKYTSILVATMLVVASASSTAKNTYDDFERTDYSGWGNTRTNNPWVSQGDGDFFVENGQAIVTLPNSYSQTHAHTNFGFNDGEAVVTVSMPDTPASGFISAGVTLRNSYSASGELTAYRAALRFEPQATRLLIHKIVSGEATLLGNTSVLEVSPKPEEQFTIKFLATEDFPTTLKAKFWPTSMPEPSTWHVVTEDDEDILQNRRALAGISVENSSNYSGLGSVAYDNFIASTCTDCVERTTETSQPAPFHADVLFSQSYYQSVNGKSLSTIILNDSVHGTPTHVNISPYCRATGTRSGASNTIRFFNLEGNRIFQFIGCGVNGVSNTQAVFSRSDSIMPIPKSTHLIEIEATLHNTVEKNYPSHSNISVQILGKK